MWQVCPTRVVTVPFQRQLRKIPPPPRIQTTRQRLSTLVADKKQKKQKKKKRPKKHRVGDPKPRTTRQQIRHNNNNNNNIPSNNGLLILRTHSNKNQTELWERAVTRLEWIQTALTRVSSQYYQTTTTSPTSTTATSSARRPQRIGPDTTDPVWHFWNLLAALTPGLLIGLYCHFVGEPAVREWRAAMELERFENQSNEENAGQIWKEYQAQQQAQMQKQQSSSLWESWLSWMIEDSSASSGVSTLPVAKNPSSLSPPPPLPLASNHDTMQQPDIQSKQQQPNAHKTSTTTELQLLRQRVEQLERTIAEQRQRRLEQEFARMKQSSIALRRQEGMNSFGQKLSSSKQEQQSHSPSLPDTPKEESGWERLQNLVKDMNVLSEKLLATVPTSDSTDATNAPPPSHTGEAQSPQRPHPQHAKDVPPKIDAVHTSAAPHVKTVKGHTLIMDEATDKGNMSTKKWWKVW